MKFLDQGPIIFALFLAIIIRFSLLEHQSNDYVYYLEPWYSYIQSHGGFLALKDNFSNYTPPYLYLLTLIVLLAGNLSKVVGIKLITFPFELLCAYFAHQLVKLKTRETALPLIAFFSILFAPTLILNGSFWGQCDVIYTTGLIACLWGLAIKRKNFALISFAIALAFKQQAMFLFPLLIILTIKKYLTLKSFLWIPFVYLISIFPAFLLGRPLKDLLLIYLDQANTFKKLTLNAPNFYQWIPDQFFNLMFPLGTLLTIIILAGFIITITKIKFIITPEIIIQLALISVLLMPFCLPKMHDRYFFPADMISIIYGFYFPRYFFIPLAINLVSLMSYLPFLLGQVIIPLNILALVLGGVILALFYHLEETLYPPSITTPKNPM
ncbi:MAG: hypothetical protein ACRC6M_06390 [Microcystaceae cyanobacterium]